MESIFVLKMHKGENPSNLMDAKQLLLWNMITLLEFQNKTRKCFFVLFIYLEIKKSFASK